MPDRTGELHKSRGEEGDAQGKAPGAARESPRDGRVRSHRPPPKNARDAEVQPLSLMTTR